MMSMAAASRGLGHDTACAYHYPPAAAAAAASYFPPGDLLANNGAVLELELPPAAAAMDDCFAPELAALPPPDCYYYYSPPAPLVSANGAAAAENEMNMSCAGGDVDGRTTMSVPAGNGRWPSSRIGFRTRSEVDVLDDGFKWRKYGKKAVKSSPNPRNYYRCSVEGCGVKKRVERDRDDRRYVVTTYDGVHNHAAPGAVATCSAPLVAAAPWSAPAAPCDVWAAAHSSESSY